MEQVELLPVGYRAVCAICGQETKADGYPEGKRPFKTFSLGLSEETAFAAGVVQFCPEHIEIGNAVAVLNTWFLTRGRTQITAALGQWDLPDGSFAPVFVLGTVVYDDGRVEARIVTVDEDALKNPLHVPVEQVATWTPPQSS